MWLALLCTLCDGIQRYQFMSGSKQPITLRQSLRHPFHLHPRPHRSQLRVAAAHRRLQTALRLSPDWQDGCEAGVGGPTVVDRGQVDSASRLISISVVSVEEVHREPALLSGDQVVAVLPVVIRLAVALDDMPRCKRKLAILLSVERILGQVLLRAERTVDGKESRLFAAARNNAGLAQTHPLKSVICAGGICGTGGGGIVGTGEGDRRTGGGPPWARPGGPCQGRVAGGRVAGGWFGLNMGAGGTKPLPLFCDRSRTQRQFPSEARKIRPRGEPSSD